MKFELSQHYTGSKGTHPKRKGLKTTWHGPFPNRQTARQWCRNHWHLHQGVCIRLPDGTVEEFSPNAPGATAIAAAAALPPSRPSRNFHHTPSHV